MRPAAWSSAPRARSTSVTTSRSCRTSSESIERSAPRYILRLTFCEKSRGLRGERRAAADPDRAADRAGARRTRALLRVRLASAAAHFGARLLRLGTGAAGRAIGIDDLEHQGLVVVVAEVRSSDTCNSVPPLATLSFMASTSCRLGRSGFGRGGFGGRLRAARLGRGDLGRRNALAARRRAALTEGRTITWPPSEPGTAPLISSRLRSASTPMTFRFSVVRRTTPMWPDMRLPGNTRPGVWRWPIEPGTRCDTECAVRGVAAGEIVALHDAGIALADRDAGDVDELARRETVDLELAARLQVGVVLADEAELDQPATRLDVGLGVMTGDAPSTAAAGGARRRSPAPRDSRRSRPS